MKITVSCVQLLPKLGDKKYNLDKMKERADALFDIFMKQYAIWFHLERGLTYMQLLD